MRMTYFIHQQGPPSWFYDVIPDFLAHYDRVMTEWKGLGYSRPSFVRKKDIQQPPVERQPPVGDAREVDIHPSAPSTSQQTAPPILQKRPREVLMTIIHELVIF